MRAEREMTHTPGPWKISTKRGPLHDIGSTDPPAIKDSAGEYIAVLGGGSVHYANANANACLIASAPDLLAALKGFVAYWEGGFMPTIKASILQDARAAIAKATQSD
jgi:hypothetical protein